MTVAGGCCAPMGSSGGPWPGMVGVIAGCCMGAGRGCCGGCMWTGTIVGGGCRCTCSALGCCRCGCNDIGSRGGPASACGAGGGSGGTWCGCPWSEPESCRPACRWSAWYLFLIAWPVRPGKCTLSRDQRFAVYAVGAARESVARGRGARTGRGEHGGRQQAVRGCALARRARGVYLISIHRHRLHEDGVLLRRPIALAHARRQVVLPALSALPAVAQRW